jgi:hypothetical protein
MKDEGKKVGMGRGNRSLCNQFYKSVPEPSSYSPPRAEVSSPFACQPDFSDKLVCKNLRTAVCAEARSMPFVSNSSRVFG